MSCYKTDDTALFFNNREELITVVQQKLITLRAKAGVSFGFFNFKVIKRVQYNLEAPEQISSLKST